MFLLEFPAAANSGALSIRYFDDYRNIKFQDKVAGWLSGLLPFAFWRGSGE
jgi:hypothetical protein